MTRLSIHIYIRFVRFTCIREMSFDCVRITFFCHLLIFSSIFNRNEKKNNLNTIRIVGISKVKTYDTCIHPYMYKICKVYLHVSNEFGLCSNYFFKGIYRYSNQFLIQIKKNNLNTIQTSAKFQM